MAKKPFLRRLAVFLLAILVLGGIGTAYFLSRWPRHPPPRPLPAPGTALYEEYADAFQLGVAALGIEAYHAVAEAKLTEAIEKIPEEPAAWADRGLLFLRDNRVSEAAADFQRAHELAPDSAEIEMLLGRLADRRVNFAEAETHYRQALKLDPEDLTIRLALAQTLLRQWEPGSDDERQKLLAKILDVQPYNLYVLSEYIGVTWRCSDAPAFRDAVKRFHQLAPSWTPDTRKSFEPVEKLEAIAQQGEPPVALMQFQNVLKQESGFAQSHRAISPSDDKDNIIAYPIEHFLRLAPLRTTAASADTELTFVADAFPTIPAIAGKRWDIAQVVWLSTGPDPAVFVANGQEVQRADAAAPALAFPGGPKSLPPSPSGLLAIDWNNDNRTDLLLAGAGGLRFFQQAPDGSFQDITAKTGLEKSILEADYYGAWAADYDLDGDLDIIAARRSGPPLVLRNNRDGTFKALEPFAGVEAVRAFVWADLDNDGAPDAAFLDSQGRLHVYANERSGQFRKRQAPARLGKGLALAAADVTDDGVFDLLVLQAGGAIVRVSDHDKGKSWEVAEVASGPAWPTALEPGSAVFFPADVDNNGALDLVASTSEVTHIWLSDPAGEFQLLEKALPGRVFGAADFSHAGRLDLLALGDKGQPVRLVNRGARPYHWCALRPRANPLEKGDNRINSFGIGGEAEVRAGLLVQKQLITSPVVHFGLGERPNPDIIRFLWTNGLPQFEFDQKGDRVVEAEQRLKGSCPFLFTFDGQGIQFVTDFMWSTPLGMYINAQDKGGFLQTTDWVKIRGDQLISRDGIYDVRVTANLWETHYYDYMALMVVDHPPGTEIYVDERFFLTPTTPEVHVTEPPRPVARAWDQDGQDVTEIVRAIDGNYLDTCGRGQFQGITQDHWVEVDLGEEAPREGPLWLVARGWVHPTDSSVNFAIEQGRHDRPNGLVLEIPDGKGGWKVGRPALGFPAGKDKTILIRLDGIESSGVTRRFRLRTNMEIYWDALAYARRLDSHLARQQTLRADSAELRFHGIVKMTQANRSSPEIPHYDQLVSRGQHWRDLIGYYTRYGDVRELLAQVDDRYVIMNAGDEIAFQFRAPEGPPSGWKRDFVWVCDGWAKDGDLNTRFSKTVLPLPAHDVTSYIDPPGRLEDDPVYRRFPEDWQKFHTRYVTPFEFEQGLRAFQRAKK